MIAIPSKSAPIPTNAATAMGDGDTAGGGAVVGAPALSGTKDPGRDIGAGSGPGPVVVIAVDVGTVVGAGAVEN